MSFSRIPAPPNDAAIWSELIKFKSHPRRLRLITSIPRDQPISDESKCVKG